MSKILLNTGRSRRGPSRFAPFILCLQKGAHQEIHGTETLATLADKEALLAGSAGHVGEAHFMRRAQAKQQGEAVSQWYTPREAIKLYCKQEIQDPQLSVKIETMMLRTHRLYRQEMPSPPGKILAVEEEVFGIVGTRHDDVTGGAKLGLWAVREEAIDALVGGNLDACRSYHDDAWILPTLSNEGRPVWVSKRLDLTFERRDGMVVDVDYKFLSHVTKSSRLAYLLDLQFGVIRILGRQIYGQRYGGVEVWCIEKAAKAAATRVKVERAHLPPVDTDKRIPRLLVWVEDQIDAHREVAPLAWPRAASELVCVHRYGMCPYFDVCESGIGGAFNPEVLLLLQERSRK